MKKIPNRAFNELLRLADELAERPNYRAAQELRGILYEIHRDQPTAPHGAQTPVQIDNEVNGLELG